MMLQFAVVGLDAINWEIRHVKNVITATGHGKKYLAKVRKRRLRLLARWPLAFHYQRSPN